MKYGLVQQSWRFSAPCRRTADSRSLARRIFLIGLLAATFLAGGARSEMPGHGELTPPDVSAPVTGENTWPENIGTDLYPASAPLVPSQPVDFDASYEGRLFTASDVRSIVREELSAYEKAKAEEAAGHVVGSDLSMSATWNNGLELSTKAKDFRVHVGGRTQFDTSWYSADQNVNNHINNPYADGMDIRRARLRVDGTMYEVIDWACEYDFVNGVRVRNSAGDGTADLDVTAPTDLWFQVKYLPVIGNCKIGNQKEAIGFEHLVSSRWLPFMERSFNQDSFYGGAYNGFTPGIAFYNTVGEEEMGTWNVGVYKPGNSVFAFNNFDGDFAVTARLTRLLWYVDDGRGLLHLGVSGRQSSTTNDQMVFRTRSAIRSGIAPTWPVPASTGTLFGDDMQWLNTEVVGVYGPWTVQAEYLVSGLQDARAVAAAPPVGNVTYHGGYCQVMYFLTGEHDNYNKKTAVFERLTPKENFFFVRDASGGHCRGRGAWQIGARYNFLDLNDMGLNGGILHDMTAGVNWFLNPNSKVQFNYTAMYRDAALPAGLGDGWVHMWGTRVAFDF